MKPSNTKRAEKRGHVMDVLQTVSMTAAGVVFLLALFWMGGKVVDYVVSSWWPTRQISVGTFTAGAGTLPDTAGSAGKILGAKLERLKRFTRKDPSQFGLVQAPNLIAVPDQLRERQGDMRKRLESINLKVKDVAVGDIAKLIDTVFEPARPRLDGTITDYGDRLEVRSELLWKDRVLDGWVASRAQPKAADASTKKDELLNELYDDLVFQMIFDLPRNPQLPWFTKYSTDDEIPNWQTLEALTLGLEALENYRLSLDYEDLKRSVRYLDRIPTYAPGYALGHYFLALALGEDRQEERAASVFGAIENMNCTAELRWAAKYQQAAAMLRQYRSQQATDAANSILVPLITELKAASAEDTGERKNFALQLIPLAEAQLSYTYSTMLTLSSSLSDSELKQKAENGWNEAHEDFKTVLEWRSEAEKKEVQSWILNAQGYGIFRIAQKELGSGSAVDQKQQEAFKAACVKALDTLGKANELNPNNYEILQNQAMILDDTQFDPDAKHLVEAEALYERTKRFVPRDYYQYERLARIFWRRAESQPVPTFRDELVKSGLENVAAAQKYRPNARLAAACGAYFFMASADTEKDLAKQKSSIQMAMANSELLLNLKAQKLDELKPIVADTVALMLKVAPRISDQSERDALTNLANRLK